MIIKPIENQTDSLDDISNIKHARRFIFIYKYNSPRGALLNEFDHPSEIWINYTKTKKIKIFHNIL